MNQEDDFAGVSEVTSRRRNCAEDRDWRRGWSGQRETGAREWDRTTDHLHVKEVLYAELRDYREARRVPNDQIPVIEAMSCPGKREADIDHPIALIIPRPWQPSPTAPCGAGTSTPACSASRFVTRPGAHRFRFTCSSRRSTPSPTAAVDSLHDHRPRAPGRSPHRRAPSPRCPARNCSSTRSRARPDDAVRVHLYAPDGTGRIVYVHPETLADPQDRAAHRAGSPRSCA